MNKHDIPKVVWIMLHESQRILDLTAIDIFAMGDLAYDDIAGEITETLEANRHTLNRGKYSEMATAINAYWMNKRLKETHNGNN